MFRVSFQTSPDTQKRVKVLVPVTSEKEYRELRNSERNLSVLNKVRAMYDNYRRKLSEGADASELRALKDALDKEKSHLVQFVYSCVPGDDMLLKGCTEESEDVGMDVDFDPSDPDFGRKMAEAPQRIIGMAEQLGLGMLERSAGKGYHIVFRRHLDLTQEENLKWASELIGCLFDERAMDITRVFFSTSASSEDLLFLSPALFAPEANLPVKSKKASELSAGSTNATTTEPLKSGALPAPPDPSAYSYQGIPFTRIIAKYWELFNGGNTPCDGARNTLTYELALNLRCIRDFSAERLMEVIPIYDGLPVEEWKQAIANANSQPRKGMAYRMRRVLEALVKEQKSTTMPLGLTCSQPPMLQTRMPEPLRKMADLAPQFLKTTVSEGVFGALSTHLHDVTFELIDGKICEPAIMQILIYRQSGGKGCIDTPIECINEELQLHADADRLREDEWKQKNPSGAKKKEKYPEDIYIQTCESDMTNAAFVKRLVQCNRNGKRPIFVQMVELDEITALSTNGRNDVTRIIRKAFDRKNYGQERVGTDSVSGVAPCRFNFTAATTPVRAIQMCKSWVPDGTLSRCNLMTIDPQDGEQKVKYKPCTQRYKDSIRPYIERLDNASGLIRCKKALQLAERLSDQLKDSGAGADSDAIQTLAPRAVTIAYWKAMILYIMAGKWSTEIESYVEWSLKRDIWVKLHFFGKKMEDDLEAETKLETFHPQTILEVMSNPFIEEQFRQKRAEMNYKGNYKEHLKKLRQRKQIAFDDTINQYVILTKEK